MSRSVSNSSVFTGASVHWWLGGEGEVFPEVVPVLVEVLGSEGGHGGGSWYGPVHAGAFETLADELLRGRLNHPGSDLPTALSIAGIVGPIELRLDVVDQFLNRFARARAAPFDFLQQPVQQTFAA